MQEDVTIRCSTASLPEIQRLLTLGARDRVKEIGFKNMLSLPSFRNPLKKHIETLMDRARVTDEGEIVVHIMDGVELILKPEDVFLILGVGMAGGKSKELPQGNDQSSNVNEQMYNLLKYAADKYGTKKHVVAVPDQD